MCEQIGTYPELMAQGGEFSRLMNTYQLAEEAEDTLGPSIIRQPRQNSLKLCRSISISPKNARLVRSIEAIEQRDLEAGSEAATKDSVASLRRALSAADEQRLLKTQVNIQQQRLVLDEEVAIGTLSVHLFSSSPPLPLRFR